VDDHELGRHGLGRPRLVGPRLVRARLVGARLVGTGLVGPRLVGRFVGRVHAPAELDERPLVERRLALTHAGRR
jgi:hypothetical protein